jgi:hypothetical protein
MGHSSTLSPLGIGTITPLLFVYTVDHGGTKDDEIDLSGGGFGHWFSHHWKEIGTGIAGVALLAGQFVPGVDLVEDGALAAEAGEAGADAGEAGADAGEQPAASSQQPAATRKHLLPLQAQGRLRMPGKPPLPPWYTALRTAFAPTCPHRPRARQYVAMATRLAKEESLALPAGYDTYLSRCHSPHPLIHFHTPEERDILYLITPLLSSSAIAGRGQEVR